MSIVNLGPINRKSQPRLAIQEALCITYSCETSLYAKTISSTSCSRTMAGRSSSGRMGIPFG